MCRSDGNCEVVALDLLDTDIHVSDHQQLVTFITLLSCVPGKHTSGEIIKTIFYFD